MDVCDYLVDFYKTKERLAPGSKETTLKALSYLPQLKEGTEILDLGCGTGAQSIVLAENTQALVTGLDWVAEFLLAFVNRGVRREATDRLRFIQADMRKTALPEYMTQIFDVIWSEGAIHHMGFEKGLTGWREFLKEDGYIAVSEPTWLTDDRPKEIEDFWTEKYSEIGTVAEKLNVVKKTGYKLVGHFTLPVSDWMDHYYNPIRASADDYLKEQNYAENAKEMWRLLEKEIEMYEKYKEYYGYVFYIAQKKDMK